MLKRPSKRRLKRRFLRYRAVPFHDVWRHGLDAWTRRFDYHIYPTMMIQRKTPVITFTMEEFSAQNLAMFLFGEAYDDASNTPEG